MGPGALIAIGVVLLYTVLGPLVLFAIYVLFDSLYKSGRPGKNQQDKTIEKKDPALWTSEDIDVHMNRIF
ncbi:MAG: hypothetical protein HGJ91_10420 [Desulfobacula sp.]|nr:hypothetical protein [Desulfobacula sp.]